MSIVSDLLRELSGGENRSTEDTAPGIPSAILERARAQQEIVPPAAASVGAYTGASFQDLWLNVADASWANGKPQRFGLDGHGIFFARDGSAPDVVVIVNTGKGDVRLSPGCGFVGGFDGFTVRLASVRRAITRHDARLVILRDPSARYVESAGASSRFRPVPLLGGDRLLGEAGLAMPGINTFYPQGFSKLLVEMATTVGNFGATDALVFGVNIFAANLSGSASYSSTAFQTTIPLGAASGFNQNILTVDVPIILGREPRLVDREQGFYEASVSWSRSGTGTNANLWIAGIQ